VNVRFIAATNGDPEAALASGDLREDLYYRLRVVPIVVPPLRDRPEDIPLLAEYFLSTYWGRHRGRDTAAPTLSEAAIRTLCVHPWRGNVRELQNVIEHVAVIAEPGGEISAANLQLPGDAAPPNTGNPSALISTLLEESYHVARDRITAQFERQYLTWLVNRVGGNMSKAARVAGVDRTTLYRMMERHGLQRSHTAGWVVAREPAGEGANDEAAPTPEQVGKEYAR
jgi:DNA-binding NtrC family response regulator